MIFSSSFFIFAFLPVTLLVYYLCKPWRSLQNIWLVIVSLFFYAWGEPRAVFLMLCSIFVNYLFGIAVDRFRTRKYRAYLTIAVMLIYNLGILFLFKYLNFVVTTLNLSEGYPISLPIGISFYTFQSISYVIDVYRQDGKVQKNPLNVALYISFFPQLIAGPIVRYETIAHQIRYRRETLDSFTEGVRRFILGLGKKLLLANAFAPIADYAFANLKDLSALSAWIGALCYAFQIYFDFSGYSDMAIGMGKMFGFEFLENFSYPYISRSVTEFWRRWHISLGTWFRDYVYIPLGGSRVKHRYRLVFNLFVVWSLTGIWHGANWTFIFWGLWYFILLTFEKLSGILRREKNILGNIVSYIVTMLCVLFGWVLFRADSLQNALIYLHNMFFSPHGWIDSLAKFWLRDLALLFITASIVSTPLIRNLSKRMETNGRHSTFYTLLNVAAYMILFLLCIGSSVNSSYNPFIYFNF